MRQPFAIVIRDDGHMETWAHYPDSREIANIIGGPWVVQYVRGTAIYAGEDTEGPLNVTATDLMNQNNQQTDIFGHAVLVSLERDQPIPQEIMEVLGLTPA